MIPDLQIQRLITCSLLTFALISNINAGISIHEISEHLPSSLASDQLVVKAIDPFAENPPQDGVPGARVVLIDLNSQATDTLLTNNAGEAIFTIDPAGSYEVKILSGPIPLPVKVSVYDLLILQKHLIGIKSISFPQLLIAGDVNNNCNLSVSDLLAIRNAILDPDQLQALAWDFYPEDIQFFNASDPCAGNTGLSYIFDAADFPGPDPVVFIFEGYARGNVSG